MEKIKKVYSVKIISSIVAIVFIFNSTVYGMDALAESCLRIPVGEKDIHNRISTALEIPRKEYKGSPFTQIVQDIFYGKGYIVDPMPLGQGWRAVVYKAKEASTGKQVAIKIANPYGDPFTPEMCRAYCLSMRSAIEFWKRHGIFNHNIPVLAQLYEAGFIPAENMRQYAPVSNKDLFQRLQWDYHYQIMELIEGEELESLLKKGFFKGKNIEMLISSLEYLISGIEAMHNKGIAHGELLSKNIKVSVSPEGRISFKLVDLDPMRSVSEGRTKDYLYLKGLIFRIMQQAEEDSDAVNKFFSRWDEQAFLEKGLPGFSAELKKLKIEQAIAAEAPADENISGNHIYTLDEAREFAMLNRGFLFLSLHKAIDSKRNIDVNRGFDNEVIANYGRSLLARYRKTFPYELSGVLPVLLKSTGGQSTKLVFLFYMPIDQIGEESLRYEAAHYALFENQPSQYYYTLEKSLPVWEETQEFASLRSKQDVRILILGSVYSGNYVALRKQLDSCGIDGSITLVDNNEIPLAILREKQVLKNGDNAVNGDVTRMKFSGRKFDVMYGDYILSCVHPGRIEDFFKSVSENIAPDGVIFLTLSCNNYFEKSKAEEMPFAFNALIVPSYPPVQYYIGMLSFYQKLAEKYGLRFRIIRHQDHEYDSDIRNYWIVISPVKTGFPVDRERTSL